MCTENIPVEVCMDITDLKTLYNRIDFVAQKMSKLMVAIIKSTE